MLIDTPTWRGRAGWRSRRSERLPGNSDVCISRVTGQRVSAARQGQKKPGARCRSQMAQVKLRVRTQCSATQFCKVPRPLSFNFPSSGSFVGAGRMVRALLLVHCFVRLLAER